MQITFSPQLFICSANYANKSQPLNRCSPVRQQDRFEVTKPGKQWQPANIRSGRLLTLAQIRAAEAIPHSGASSTQTNATTHSHYFAQTNEEALAQMLKQMMAEEEIRYTKSGNLTLNMG